MPALSWNEIRQNAIQFARDWEGVTDERAEAQSFWNDFFKVFGIKRKTIAAFEERVKSVKQTYHRIDVFVPGTMLAEHKSAGESLDKAQSQAFQYIEDLFRNNRQDEIPRYIVLCNFHTFALYDLEPDEQLDLPLWKDKPYNRIEFHISEMHSHAKYFAFLIGQKTHKFQEEDPANLEAAQLMADLHDEVEKIGYPQRDMERLLVRLLFCLFADDTGIFDPSQFELYIENKTKPDGSDLGLHLHGIFDALNTPGDARGKSMDEDLAAFPYVNGELFAEQLKTVHFNRDMRNRLVAACRFDWSRISPAIFGSLFQGIMDARERRQIGAHYTSERDIMKLIRPLFLDDLQEEFARLKKNRGTRRESELRKFHEKLASLKFLDPACGCGNFLVIAYRELRLLEIEVMNELAKKGELLLPKVDVNQFFGIEIGEWPTRIAETALWLTDHQMNNRLSETTGHFFQRIPLSAAPHILCANALRMDWNGLLPASECSYVLGNPPFIGAKFMTDEQKADVRHIAGNVKNYGLLDYVTMWYFKAAEYVKQFPVPCAFVSTNSISQGEQVGILWSALASKGIRTHFAHRTFSWQSEAKGKAHVHVVIIGFGRLEKEVKFIYEYDNIRGEPEKRTVSNINPYLIDAQDGTIANRATPICDVPVMFFGNQPIDGGNLLLDRDAYDWVRKNDPLAKKYVRKFIGAMEFINGIDRWCLWLPDAAPSDCKKSKFILERLEAVRKFRTESKRSATRELAATPALFAFISHKETKYLVIPSVSSERREYIPIGFMPRNVIASNLCLIIPRATSYHFGILTSAMHMAWVRQVCGRLKSDFRYSAKLVYNNFPWPEHPTAAQQAKVEECAQGVLDTREKYLQGSSSLADLYDPVTMPLDLLKAHQALDRAVDRCYRAEKFESERERVEFLFGLYEKLTSPLALSEPVKKKRGGKKKKIGQNEQD